MRDESYVYKTSAPDRYELLKKFAQENRKKMTYAETVLWENLRGMNIGAKFRRQHIIGDFIVDFACLEKHLVIEVDGGYHAEPRQQTDDQLRTEWLNKMGYRVLRFSNEQVVEHPDETIQTIRACCKQSEDVKNKKYI